MPSKSNRMNSLMTSHPRESIDFFAANGGSPLHLNVAVRIARYTLALLILSVVTQTASRMASKPQVPRLCGVSGRRDGDVLWRMAADESSIRRPSVPCVEAMRYCFRTFPSSSLCRASLYLTPTPSLLIGTIRVVLFGGEG